MTGVQTCALPICYKWYGEPPASVRADFERQAKDMNLDRPASPQDAETISERLWRRYDKRALELLAMIREDSRQAETIIEGADYLRGEIALMQRQEMIVRLEDFLRRRSMLALTMRREDIHQAKGLLEACEILFGSQAKAKYDEYFAAPA